MMVDTDAEDVFTDGSCCGNRTLFAKIYSLLRRHVHQITSSRNNQRMEQIHKLLRESKLVSRKLIILLHQINIF